MKKEINLHELIEEGESSSMEFKASAIYSFDKEQHDKNLFYPIIKSICALANSEGGKIVVGYHERQEKFVGIEKDGKKDNDSWERYLRSHLDAKTDKFTGTLVDFFFQKIDDVTCAIIEVKRSPTRISCKDLTKNDETHFYVRSGPSTKSLNFDEGIRYQEMRFGREGRKKFYSRDRDDNQRYRSRRRSRRNYRRRYDREESKNEDRD